MATSRRTTRLNSLLKEVLSEVIHRNVKNPKLDDKLITVTKVDISKDLQHAKIYISVIGDDADKKEVFNTLKSASGFISVIASKKVVMHHFPKLKFFIDNSVDKHMRIEEVLSKVEEERQLRKNENS